MFDKIQASQRKWISDWFYAKKTIEIREFFIPKWLLEFLVQITAAPHFLYYSILWVNLMARSKCMLLRVIANKLHQIIQPIHSKKINNSSKKIEFCKHQSNMFQNPTSKTVSSTPPGPLPNHNPPDRSLNYLLKESMSSTQLEIQHQKQRVKHWFFATRVAGAGKGNFLLLDTAAAVSPFFVYMNISDVFVESPMPSFYLFSF